MNSKNIVIVGATGFIGSSLSAHLIRNKSWNVISIGRTKSDYLLTLSKENLNFKFLEHDLSTNVNWDFIPKNIEVLYYLVSGTHPSKSWDSPQIEVDLNINPFINFFNTLLEKKIDLKKMVFLSSGGTVYGESQRKVGGFTEEDITKPFTPYGIFKKTQEDLGRYYSRKLKFRLYIFRIGNVFGPNPGLQKEFGVINIWLGKLIKGEPIQIFGSQNIVRDYIYINDLVKILEIPILYFLESGDYNISTGNHCSLNEIITIIKKISSEKITIETNLKRESDADIVALNGAKFNNSFKLEPTLFQKAIEETYFFMKNDNIRK